MNKIKYILIFTITLGSFSCSDDFLERKNLYQVLDDTYFADAQQISEALTGAYSVLPVGEGFNSPMLLANLLSPDCLGGGGVEDLSLQACDLFENGGEDNYLALWTETYKGVFRTNTIISRFNQADYGDNQKQKDQDLGETYFLRAYYYFQLCQFFGTVPLITVPEPVNLPRAEPEALFAQIASDLKNAAELMPESSPNKPVERMGHATKWAAKGYLARVFLYYTGTYGKDALPLTDGGSITKQDVILHLEDVIKKSGHGLLTDFPNLWPYTSDIIQNYQYRENNGYSWIGEDGDNIETVFAIKFNTTGNWGPIAAPRTNQVALFSGVRNNLITPFAEGWGFAPVHPSLWESFEDNDVRKTGSMVNLEDAETVALEGDFATVFDKESYNGMNVTGIFQKKHSPVQGLDSESGLLKNLWVLMGYSTADDNYMINMHDVVLLRFADILLMHSELTETVESMNLVRERSNLEPLASYSLDALKEERRHELCFEGLRYFDLTRWGDLSSAFNEMPVANVANGTFGPNGEYPAEYKAIFKEDRKFLPIPESQIRLSNGPLKQHPGWE